MFIRISSYDVTNVVDHSRGANPDNGDDLQSLSQCGAISQGDTTAVSWYGYGKSLCHHNQVSLSRCGNPDYGDDLHSLSRPSLTYYVEQYPKEPLLQSADTIMENHCVIIIRFPCPGVVIRITEMICTHCPGLAWPTMWSSILRRHYCCQLMCLWASHCYIMTWFCPGVVIRITEMTCTHFPGLAWPTMWSSIQRRHYCSQLTSTKYYRMPPIRLGTTFVVEIPTVFRTEISRQRSRCTSHVYFT
jgi:hypothetical protein